MALTLRRIRLGPPVYAHLADYSVHEDGEPIGRTMEERQDQPTKGPEHAWSWSLTIIGAHRAGVRTTDYAPSLAEAKTAFKASLDGYQAWLATQPSEPP
jgi:hypothetical protein